MSARKFKFVSPGVFLNEIDNSQLPKISDAVGPILIGRSERGPALKPVRVESFSSFVEIFGNPLPGGSGTDVWRQGNGYLAPTYAVYAAQAYLRNSSPITFVRLLGIQDKGAATVSGDSNGGQAGWDGRAGLPAGASTAPKAWGLFVGVSQVQKARITLTADGTDIPANGTLTLVDNAAPAVTQVYKFGQYPAAVGSIVAVGLTALRPGDNFTIKQKDGTSKTFTGHVTTTTAGSNFRVVSNPTHETGAQLTLQGMIPTDSFIEIAKADGVKIKFIASNNAIHGAGNATEKVFKNNEGGDANKAGDLAACINSSDYFSATNLDENDAATAIVRITRLGVLEAGFVLDVDAITLGGGSNLVAITSQFVAPALNLSDTLFQMELAVKGVADWNTNGTDAAGTTLTITHTPGYLADKTITLTANGGAWTNASSNAFVQANPRDLAPDGNALATAKILPIQESHGQANDIANMEEIRSAVQTGTLKITARKPGAADGVVISGTPVLELEQDSSGSTQDITLGANLGNAIDLSEAGDEVATDFSAAASSAKSALAAVIYPNTSKKFSVGLSGVKAWGGTDDTAETLAFHDPRSHIAIEATNEDLSSAQFELAILDTGTAAGTDTVNKPRYIKRVKCDFNPASPNFIRKVLNTNPVKTNSRIIDDEGLEHYWLGETFEHYLVNEILKSSNGTKAFAWTAPLVSGDDHGDNLRALQGSQTGWFIAQNTLTSNDFDAQSATKLFKFASLNDGASQSRDFKITIADIKSAPSGGTNPYGSFSVVVRRASDNDNAPQIVERFSSCNLNPDSSDYVARKIGDMYQEWHNGEKRYKHYGNYVNMSRYIRIVVDASVNDGNASEDLLPFGVFGPPVYKSFTKTTTSDGESPARGQIEGTAVSVDNTFWCGDVDESDAHYDLDADGEVDAGTSGRWLTGHSDTSVGLSLTCTVPTLRLRLSGSDGGMVDPSRACFGLQTSRNADSTRSDPSYVDFVRPNNATNENDPNALTTRTEYSWVFTLDDIIVETDDENNLAKVFYLSGSHQSNTFDAVNNVDNVTRANVGGDGVSTLLMKYGIDKFTSPMFGGNDGVDITEAEPFNNDALKNAATPQVTNSYVYASVKRAIDSVSDPEAVESNVMAMPGITEPSLTTMLVRNCESRADSLAVIDLPDVYTPPHETYRETFKDRVGDGVQSVVDAFSTRGVNSSYGCTYYPWLKIYDEINDSQLFIPPSVVALGTFANTERKAALWFAPAGFNRGGLTEGSAGLSVIGVTERLTSKDRDKLYSVNINPIATFPAEGIVVFGQKTLQTSQSALDRINVRRLMIYVKKQVSRIANRILFDQNVQATWDRFTGQVEPFLDRIKLGFGLTDFKVVLDKTTTTPDLVDRNILYAKIFLKPARSIEFIAIDFVITNTGAAFED
jgi:hypothetical protein